MLLVANLSDILTVPCRKSPENFLTWCDMRQRGLESNLNSNLRHNTNNMPPHARPGHKGQKPKPSLKNGRTEQRQQKRKREQESIQDLEQRVTDLVRKVHSAV